jgi:hypothetical protein
MRHAARTDANKSTIVEALRAAGCIVYDLRLPVDLMVGVPGNPGVTLLMELKDGRKPPSARGHTDVQARFLANWPAPTCTVTDVESALRAVAAVRSKA